MSISSGGTLEEDRILPSNAAIPWKKLALGGYRHIIILHRNGIGDIGGGGSSGGNQVLVTTALYGHGTCEVVSHSSLA